MFITKIGQHNIYYNSQNRQEVQNLNNLQFRPTELFIYFQSSLYVNYTNMILNQLKSLVHPIKYPIRLLTSNTDNIHFNLATEQYIFQKQQLKAPILFLWRNNTNIVIGKHQNPWKQCKVQQMKKNNVLLARRKTGGGAVYHDLGNTCFSFFNPDQSHGKFDYKAINNALLIETFKSLGVNAQVSGRNDITVLNKKISGSAYRLHLGGKDGIGRKALHHGTVLFSVDVNALQRYLNPNKKKLQSKGIDSVKSRVMNLSQQFPRLNHDVFCKQISRKFCQFYEQNSVTQLLDYQTLNMNKQINDNYKRLTSWEWIFGQTPDFKYSIEKKFDWGLNQIQFNIHQAHIKQAKVFSDCLYPDFITLLDQKIKGIRFDQSGINELRKRMIQERMQTIPNFTEMVQDVCEWITQQL